MINEKHNDAILIIRRLIASIDTNREGTMHGVAYKGMEVRATNDTRPLLETLLYALEQQRAGYIERKIPAPANGVFLKQGASALIFHPEEGFTLACAKSNPSAPVPPEVVCLASLMLKLQERPFREYLCQSFDRHRMQ